jgi:ribosomal-protein-alanine N-acetyltransferase
MTQRARGSETAATRHRAREATASRVYLREPVPEDLDEFVRLRRASREFLEPRAGERRVAFLVRASADDAVLGAVSFFHVERGPIQGAQVAWWVGAQHAQRGVMSAALELALERAFGPLALQRVEALIVPENEPSRRLARRAGFELEGTARGYAELGGRRRDHERWSLTRAEWLERRGRCYLPQSRK